MRSTKKQKNFVRIKEKYVELSCLATLLDNLLTDDEKAARNRNGIRQKDAENSIERTSKKMVIKRLD